MGLFDRYRSSLGFRAAALVSTGAQYSIQLLGFIKIALISRLLSPTEIGVYSIAAVLIFLVQVFRYLGTSEYIVTVVDLTDQVLSVCFTILIALAVIVTSLVMLSAPHAALFFDMPELERMLQIMAIAFLILPFDSIVVPLMTRRMEFVPLSVIRVVQTLVDTLVTIVLIMMGAGLFSLAWAYVASNVISTAMAIAYDPKNVVFRPRLEGAGQILRFGSLSSLGTLLNNVGQFAPTLFLGRGFDAATVAQFTRGQTIVTFMRQGLEVATGHITMAWFADRAQQDTSQSRAAFLRFLSVTTALSCPIYFFVALNAATLIPLLLGPNWSQAVAVTQALALGAIFAPYSYAGGQVLVGRGRVGLRLSFLALLQAQRVGLIYLAINWSFDVFAWVVAASNVIGFFIIAPFLRKEIGVSLWSMIRTLRDGIVLGSLIAIVNYALIGSDFATEAVSLPMLGFLSLVSAAIWLVTAYALKLTAWEEILTIIRKFAK